MRLAAFLSRLFSLLRVFVKQTTTIPKLLENRGVTKLGVTRCDN